MCHPFRAHGTRANERSLQTASHFVKRSTHCRDCASPGGREEDESALGDRGGGGRGGAILLPRMVTRARLALVVLLLLLAGCASLAGLNGGKGDDGGVDSGRASAAGDGGTDSGAMNVTGDGGDAAPTT